MNNIVTAVGVQNAGAWFLLVVCAALFAHGRRPHFLAWALAWLCAAGRGLLPTGPPSESSLPALAAPALLQDAASALGAAQAALWALGSWYCARGDRGAAPSLGEKAEPGWPVRTPWALEGGALITALGLGAALSRLTGAEVRQCVSDGLFALAYLGSVALVFRASRGMDRAYGVWVLGAVQALYGILELLQAMPPNLRGAFGPEALLRGAESGLQFLLAVGLVLLLLDQERAAVRQALARLANSEDRFRLVFEHGGVGMALLTPEGRFVQVNPAVVRLLGYDSEELRGRRLSDLAHPDELTTEVRLLKADPDLTPPLYEREKRYLRKDGRSVWVRVVRVPVHDAAGQISCHVGVLVDISERKRVEETLREERDFSAQVLETADALLFVLDPEGRVVRFNGKCTAVSGYAEKEVRSRVFWDFLLPDKHSDPVKAAFERLAAGLNSRAGPRAAKPPTEFETPWVTRTREERLVAWRQTPVRDAQGRLRYVIGTGIDITEQRRLEEQLRHSQKMETLGTLVGGIAHDFNNQLTVVLGNLVLSQDQVRGPVPEAADEDTGYRTVEGRSLLALLADAERAAQHCADMTQRLLTFSRRRVGQTQPLSLNTLVQEASRLLQRVLPATIRMEMHLDASLWLVGADSTQLHQVLMNLAVNARDAMPQGGRLLVATRNQEVTPTDSASNVEARPGKFVVLSVTDTGTGMTPDVRKRIFDPFFTTKEVGQGTGLGLAMVFGIVKAHQGWITVSSEPGKGSAFHIYLPASEERVVAPPAPAAPAVRGGDECVLVVDDEDTVRNLACSVLEHWGFKVLAAPDGEQALALYHEKQREIDLVLLDYMMPKLTGLQVLQRLRGLNPKVRVIFSSGFTQSNDNDHLLAEGARAFVSKPYRPVELVQAVREVLDRA